MGGVLTGRKGGEHNKCLSLCLDVKKPLTHTSNVPVWMSLDASIQQCVEWRSYRGAAWRAKSRWQIAAALTALSGRNLEP